MRLYVRTDSPDFIPPCNGSGISQCYHSMILNDIPHSVTFIIIMILNDFIMILNDFYHSMIYQCVIFL